MATSTSDETFWGFIFYVKHNPLKSIDNMTENDFDEMVKQFALVNASATITAATAPDYPAYYGYGIVDYGDIDYPKRGSTTRYATDGSGVASGASYAANVLACEQAMYPETHLG